MKHMTTLGGVALAVMTTTAIASPSRSADSNADEPTVTATRDTADARWIKGRRYQNSKLTPYNLNLRAQQIGESRNKPWGFVSFHPDVTDGPPDGEIIRVDDHASDGYRVGMIWKTSRKRHGICYDATGYRGWAADRFCNVPNIPEKTGFYYRLGRCNNTKKRINCHQTKDWRKTGWSYHYDDANLTPEFREDRRAKGTTP